MTWEHFPHQSDIGIRGHGATPAEAFEQAAVALAAIITDPGKIEPAMAIEIVRRDENLELLFTEWINALIYEMATRRMLFSRFQVALKADSLEGRAWGESVDREKHEPAVEVKGATYTALSVRQESDGTWLAQCVVDV